MFLYTDFDQNLLNERVAQFRDQTQHYLNGSVTSSMIQLFQSKLI